MFISRRAPGLRSTRTSLGAAFATLLFLPGALAGQDDRSCPDPGSIIGTTGEPMAHVRYLADDALEGREVGSWGARCAGDYIADRFASYGLEGAGPDGSFFQAFQVRGGSQLGSHNGLKILDKDLDLGKTWAPYGFSGTGMASAAMVYGDYGLTRPGAEEGEDRFARLDLSGKVVVVEDGDPDATHGGSMRADPHFKATIAAGRGAAGLVVLLPEGAELPEAWSETRPAVSIPVAAYSGPDAEAIRSAAQSGDDAALMTQVEPRMVEARNVVAVIPGSNPMSADEVVIVGAHFDHLGFGGEGSLAPDSREIHNGADDNASGTAALMEVARRMADAGPYDRSILFLAFSGEEKGLLGASAYVNDPLLPIDESVAMINMDMVGRLSENRLTIFGLGTAEEWEDMVMEANAGLSRPFSTALNPDGYGPSDHAAFYGAGIPVLHFFTNTHSEYHRPEDDWDLINDDGLIRVAEMVTDLSTQLGGTSGHPAVAMTVVTSAPNPHGGAVAAPQAAASSDPGAAPSRSSGYGPYLGSIPDMGFTEGGVRLTGVREGSPAEDGGLQAGDVVVEWNGTEIGDLYAYTYALRDHAPGDEVELVVLRDGERITVMVTLGQR